MGLGGLVLALDCAYPPIVRHVALTIDQHKSNQGADWLSWCGQYNKVSLSTSCIFIPPLLPLQQRQRVHLQSINCCPTILHQLE